MKLASYSRAIILTLTLINVCRSQDLVRTVKSASPREVLAKESIANLPFIARDQLMLRLFKQYSELTPRNAFQLLQEEEKINSTRNGMKPLVPVLWRKGCSICSVEYSKGREYLTLRYGPLTISISAGEFEKFTETLVVASLERDTKLTIDVLPSNIQLVEIEPEIAPLKMATIQEVAKSVRHGAGWKAALVGGIGSMATRDIYREESGSFSGGSASGSFRGDYNGRSITTVPDETARRNAREKANQLLAAADARSNAIFDTALLSSTLHAGQSIAGFVYFKKDKSMKSSILQIIVGTRSFEFPLNWH